MYNVKIWGVSILNLIASIHMYIAITLYQCGYYIPEVVLNSITYKEM